MKITQIQKGMGGLRISIRKSKRTKLATYVAIFKNETRHFWHSFFIDNTAKSVLWSIYEDGVRGFPGAKSVHLKLKGLI